MDNSCPQQISTMPTIGLASAGPSLSTPHQGRPALEPTDVVRLRLPKRIIAIIQRRAAKMNKSISVYLADQLFTTRWCESTT